MLITDPTFDKFVDHHEFNGKLSHVLSKLTEAELEWLIVNVMFAMGGAAERTWPDSVSLFRYLRSHVQSSADMDEAYSAPSAEN